MHRVCFPFVVCRLYFALNMHVLSFACVMCCVPCMLVPTSPPNVYLLDMSSVRASVGAACVFSLPWAL